MSDIQFIEEQEFEHSKPIVQKPLFIRLVLKTGIVSTEKQANYILLGIVVFATACAFLIPSLIGSSAKTLTNQDIQRITELQRGVPR